MTDVTISLSDIIGRFSSQYLGYIASAATIAFGTFIYKLWKCQQRQDKRIWKLGQAFLLYVDLSADETHQLHPKDNVADIKSKIRLLLSDDSF